MVARIHSGGKDKSYGATLMVQERVGVACNRVGAGEMKRSKQIHV